MGDLEDLSQHLRGRITSLERLLDLSVTDVPQHHIKKLVQDFAVLERLLEESETRLEEEKEHLKQLKEIENSLQKHLRIVRHINENIPPHIPKKKTEVLNEPILNQTTAANIKPKLKMEAQSFKQILFITTEEFESIPQYMRGRVTYNQLNDVVQNLNSAVAAKYKILSQSAKKLSGPGLKLQQRFKEQELKDTRGQYFVVEEDIREFTQMKVDKRFLGMVTMLRHCHRLREVRQGGVVRYLL